MLRTSRLTPLLYLTPLIALMLFVFGYPMVQIINFSTRRIRGATGPFIGFENYRQVLKDDVFRQAITHNGILLLAVPILIILGVLVAVLLYERVRGWTFYRLLFFTPYIIAIPVTGTIFNNLLSLNGAINEMLRSVGLGPLALDWLGSEQMALWSIMGVIVWREVGFGVVLFLARLLSLNEELLDAARIDGAGWWQRLYYIILPELMGVIEFFAVVSVITMLAWVFPFVYVMTRGGPGNATQVMELYIYNYAFRNSLPGMASAVAVILFIVTIIFMVPLFYLRGKEDDAGAAI
jgi:ABC-type sugar transport system permease subunit